MDAAASHMIFQCAFDSCLSMSDIEIERRPYHRNCSCALHKPKDARPIACFQHGNAAFPKKQSWSDCSISTTTPKSSSQSLFVSNLAGKTKEKDGLLIIRNKGMYGNLPSRWHECINFNLFIELEYSCKFTSPHSTQTPVWNCERLIKEKRVEKALQFHYDLFLYNLVTYRTHKENLFTCSCHLHDSRMHSFMI